MQLFGFEPSLQANNWHLSEVVSSSRLVASSQLNKNTLNNTKPQSPNYTIMKRSNNLHTCCLFLILLILPLALAQQQPQNQTLNSTTTPLVSGQPESQQPPVNLASSTPPGALPTPKPIHSEPATNVAASSSDQLSSESHLLASSRSDDFIPPNDQFDGFTNEENPDGSDLSFSLMNAPQDRLLAVKDLLGLQRSASETNAVGSPIGQTGASGNLQCTHKGRRYTHGETVLIEDQPCLNCTCRRAILQCYLRVCPPIVSMEAHKKMQMASLGDLGPQHCRVVKEAHQCCPSVRCEPILKGSTEGATRLPTSLSEPANNFTNTISISLDSLGAGQMLSLAPSDDSKASVSSGASDKTPPLASEPRDEPEVGARNQLVASATPVTNRSVEESVVPDSGQHQRESILLITSNPSGNSVSGGSQSHLSTKVSRPPGTNDAQHDTSQLGHQMGSNSSGSGLSESRQNNALLEALLETYYSSAAQANGLDLQGSCMINGSLYVEGSAVIPEGNAYCQYCYCIRQKIMCIKPKCHLYISGCTAKYSSEYSCCPTSYSCTPSSFRPETAFGTRLTSAPKKPVKIQADLPQTDTQSRNMPTKISAALDSLIRLTKSAGSLSDTAADADVASARQVDGSRSPGGLSASLMNLMNSLGALTTTDSEVEGKVTTGSTTSPAGSSTSTSTTTSSTTSTTTGPTSSSSTTSAPDSGDVNYEEDDKEEDDKESTEKRAGSRNKVSEGDKRKGNQDEVVAKSDDATTQTTTASQTPSVSDFLEPMQKLGPSVMSNPTGICTENGRNYSSGEQIPTLESCKHCYCLDGIKECKMIECSLKIAHNCKPIIPEGHCCPVKYDCPSAAGVGSVGGSRFSGDQQRLRLLDTTNSFKGDSQCKTDGQSSDNCIEKANQLNGSKDEGQTEFSLENIRGLSETGTPIVESVRFTEEDFQSSGNNDTLVGQKNSSQLQEQQMNSLTEELNRFIMQINRNSTGAQHQQQMPSYSLVGSSAMNERQPPMMLQPHHVDSLMMMNGTEPDLTDQMRHSRNALPDYHSVQAIPGEEHEAVTTKALPLPGTMGIPSIEPEGDYGSARPMNQMSSVEYVNPESLRAMLMAPIQGQPRDSRSSGHLDNHVITDNHRERASLVINDNSMRFKEVDQPTTVNISDDYTDTTDNPVPNPNRPHVRLMRERPNPIGSVSPSVTVRPGTDRTATVVFDDELNNSDHALHGNATPIIIPNNQDSNSTYLLLRENSFKPDGEGENVHLLDGFEGVLKNNSAGEAIAEHLTTTQPTTTTDNNSQGFSTNPPQSTTGTPIGLEADRTRETSGWLRSLSGLVQSFGRRLTGNNQHHELQGAASNGVSPQQGEHQQAYSRPPAPAGTHEQATGRSRKSSVLNQLLKSMVSASLPPVESANDKGNHSPSGLVMRPLGSVMQVEPILSQANRTQPAVLSPYETTITTSAPSDIVTAATRSDPDIFTSPEAHGRSVEPSNKLLRRSDITDDLLTSEYESTFQRRPSSSPTIHSTSNKTPVTCYDAYTNRSYQPNEIIPKNNPCKTCTCLLGEERCQTLICPEKPAEDCREERRAGECCANYICAGSSTQVNASQQSRARLIMDPGTQTRPAQDSFSLMPTGLAGLQRARMHVDQSGSGERGNSVAHAIHLANQLIHRPSNQQQQQQLLLLQSGDRMMGPNSQSRVSSLPQQPFRTSDLSSMLPPHLRFRPNGGGQNLNMGYVPGMHSTRVNSRPTESSLNSARNHYELQTPSSTLKAVTGGAIQGTNFNSHPMRPASISHPQRSPLLSPTHGFNSNGFNQIHPAQYPMRRASLDEPALLATSQPSLGWRESAMKPTSSPPAASPQINRISFPSKPSNAPDFAMTVATAMLNPRQDLNSGSWRPSEPLVHFGPQVSSSEAPTILESSSQVNHESSTRGADEGPKLTSLVTTGPKFGLTNEISNTPERVHFQETSSSPSDLSEPQAESGFRPVNPITTTTQQSDSRPPSSTTETSSTLDTVSSSSEASSTQGSSSTTDGQTDASPSSELISISTASSSPSSSQPEVASSSESSSEMPSEPSSSSSITISPISDSSGSSESTSATGSTPTSQSSRQAADIETTQVNSEPASNSEEKATDSDPLGLFRVSECNVYGRLYKVAQPIEELSDSCKRCFCTPLGVDCQNRC